MPQSLFWITYALIFFSGARLMVRAWRLHGGFWNADHRITRWRSDEAHAAVETIIERAAKLRNAQLVFLAIVAVEGLSRLAIGATWASDILLLGAAVGCTLMMRRIHGGVPAIRAGYRRQVGCDASVVIRRGGITSDDTLQELRS